MYSKARRKKKKDCFSIVFNPSAIKLIIKKIDIDLKIGAKKNNLFFLYGCAFRQTAIGVMLFNLKDAQPKPGMQSRSKGSNYDQMCHFDAVAIND